MKQCFKCGRELPLSEFYKHLKMADGHLGKCKACAKIDSVTNRAKNLDYYVAYDRKRYKTTHRTEQIRKNAQLRVRKADIKSAARKKLNNAILYGRIKRQPCEVCGSNKTHGHHRDYSKPYEVQWLCALHHFGKHRKYDYDALIRQAENQKTNG